MVTLSAVDVCRHDALAKLLNQGLNLDTEKLAEQKVCWKPYKVQLVTPVAA